MLQSDLNPEKVDRYPVKPFPSSDSRIRDYKKGHLVDAHGQGFVAKDSQGKRYRIWENISGVFKEVYQGG